MLEDASSDQGDVTYRLATGYTASAGTDNKQKEKIRQIERQRKEANDVSFCTVPCCSYVSSRCMCASWQNVHWLC